MRTKVYLRDVDEQGDIYAIQRNEGILWTRTSQDEKGIFFVLNGELDRRNLPKYPGVREIEHIE